MSTQSKPSATTALEPIPNGLQAVCYSVLRDGSLAVVATDVDLRGEHARISSALRAEPYILDPPSQLAQLADSGRARLLVFVGDRWREYADFPLETPFPLFDCLADGRLLVVASRSNGEPNARILTQVGELISRLTLGDGIEHLGVDAQDRIWVGWFDEGVFGNDGWRMQGEEWPPSSRGLACFDLDGTLLNEPELPADAPNIYDCYALNIVSDGAWACTYSDFPVLALGLDGRSRWWSNAVAGGKALAIDGGYLLIAGGYGTDGRDLSLLALEDGPDGAVTRLVLTLELPLLRREPRPDEDPDTSAFFPWQKPDLLSGRGDTIHLVQEGTWYRWRVADILAATSIT